MNRQRHIKLLVGAPSVASDIRYASGFNAVDPVVYLERGHTRILIVPTMECGRARRQSRRGVNVLTPSALKLGRGERGRISSWILAALERLKARSVLVAPGFPLGIANRLRRAGVRMIVAKEALFPNRAVKTPREIRNISETQRAAASAMQAAVRMIQSARIAKSGHLVAAGERLTAEAVRRVIDRTLLEHECFAEETIVACGRDAADPHEHGEGALRAGETIVIDIFPRSRTHGYWGDITRTVIRGKAPEQLRQMYRAVAAAQAAALLKLKAGVTVGAVHGAVQSVFEKRGFVTQLRNDRPEGFIHSTGHGVGLDIHESPSIRPGQERLKAGQVVTIEPGLYYPKIGGVRIEDTVLVTRTGFRYLARCGKRFEV